MTFQSEAENKNIFADCASRRESDIIMRSEMTLRTGRLIPNCDIQSYHPTVTLNYNILTSP